jgi:uncharacterized protein YgiM (DUF1202 family)
MKNQIVKILIGVVALTGVTVTSVYANTFDLSVGGAAQIEGGIVCTKDTAKTKLVYSSFAGSTVAADASITVKEPVVVVEPTSQEPVPADVNTQEPASSVPTEGAIESTVSIETPVEVLAGEGIIDPSAIDGANIGHAPEGSKIAEVEHNLTLELEEKAKAEEAAANIVISAGAIDTGLEISLPAEGEEEDDGETLYGYTNLGIAVVDDHLNVRETPDDSSKIVGKMSTDTGCEILEIVGDKAHIVSGSVEGYVSVDYILTGDYAATYASQIVKKLATVSADGLKVRTAPDLEADVINMVAYGEELEVLEELEGWVKVSYDGEEAYVNSEFVSVGEDLKTALKMSEFLFGEGVSDVRVSLCEYAKQFIGNPYVWGGTSLTKGADCSGYVLSIFGKYGYSLPHSSRAQATMGTKTTVAEAKPGDLVFYSKGGRVNHVAIYIGGGQVVHASSPKYGIRITSVYYRTPTAVRRIIQD